MNFSGLYGITDATLLPPERLESAVEAALANGLSLLQYRNKHGSQADKERQAHRLVQLCHRYQVPCLVNDDVDLCLQSGADGVHLGQHDQALVDARRQLGEHHIIGVSCHNSVQLALAAEARGADYVAFGRFFPSHSKPDAPAAELATLTRAREQLSVPVVAIGGINAENGRFLIQAGADMLAVIHSLFGTDNVAANTQKLLGLFDQQTEQLNNSTN